MKSNLIKVGGIVCLCLVILLSYSIYTNAGIISYPEPPRQPNMADSLKWNSETGEYYNSESFKWNPDTKRYDEIIKDTVKPSKDGISAQDQYKWAEENKDSVNPLYKALAEAEYDSINQAPSDIRSVIRSDYKPSEDKSLDRTASLGIGYLPEMIKMIEGNHVMSPKLEGAIAKMMNTPELYKYVSGTLDGYKGWLNDFNLIVADSKNKTNGIAADLKAGKVDAKLQAKQHFERCGLFTLPYIKDTIKDGNYELAQFLPDIMSSYIKASPEELKSKDISYWKEWFADNDDDIETLRTTMGN